MIISCDNTTWNMFYSGQIHYFISFHASIMEDCCKWHELMTNVLVTVLPLVVSKGIARRKTMSSFNLHGKWLQGVNSAIYHWRKETCAFHPVYLRLPVWAKSYFGSSLVKLLPPINRCIVREKKEVWLETARALKRKTTASGHAGERLFPWWDTFRFGQARD